MEKRMIPSPQDPGGSVVKNPSANAGDWGSISGGANWQPTPVFSPGKSHGQRGLVGYSPQGRKRAGRDWVNKHVTIKNTQHTLMTLFVLSISTTTIISCWGCYNPLGYLPATPLDPSDLPHNSQRLACLFIYLWLCRSLLQHGPSSCGTKA